MDVYCYDVYWTDDTIWYSERYDLYTKPSGFFNRLSNPRKAELHHRKNQRDWLNDDNVYEFMHHDRRLFVRMCFDHNEVSRKMVIESFPNRQKTRLNE